MLTAAERDKLRRVIAVANRKGGVGKTSVTTNVAGVCADAGYKVLVLDLDQQGNAGDDLGTRGTEFDDGGASLFSALVMDQPLEPKRSIRPNLDFIPAGSHTSALTDSLTGKTGRGEDPSYLLAKRLAAIADQYDVILIDCPPGEAVLQTLALVAARWVLVPTQPDDGSLQGLAQLAERVVMTQQKNETLAPLGVVLFPVVKSGTKMQAEVREKLSRIMGDAAPVFTSTIRFAQAAGVDARSRGQLAIELARDAQGQDRFAWTKVLKAKQSGDEVDEVAAPKRLAESAGTLAGDYLELTAEILQTLAEQEQIAAQNAGVGS